MENDIPLLKDGVSRQHAVLRVTASGLVVEDQGSTNGTFIDDRRIDRAEVPPGAVLGLGPVDLFIEPLTRDDATLAIELPGKPKEPRVWDASLAETTKILRRPGEPQPLRQGHRDPLFPEGYRPGSSPAMATLYRQMSALFKAPISVLIRGETGVGKEMIARILHRSSPRSEAPFLAINCSAIPNELLEAEFFGIGKAVATGVEPRIGIFQRADGGTLLLDEIGEMPPALQAKLLRALQEQEIQPVGGTPRKVDVRILAATNTDLSAMMDAGRFRRDLFYRLAGCVLEVPPLRQCRDDIPGLVEHFLGVFSKEADFYPRGLSIQALRLLTAYSWPGNVRELEHEIRRLVYRSYEGQIIDSSLLSKSIRFSKPEPETANGCKPPAALGAEETLALAPRVRELEIQLIREALRRAGDNQTQAAQLLDLSRSGLLKKMKRLGISA